MPGSTSRSPRRNIRVASAIAEATAEVASAICTLRTPSSLQ